MKKRELSPWCKNAKHKMIDKDISITELASELNMSREYLSSIINGRVYSAPAVKLISDYLGIEENAITLST